MTAITFVAAGTAATGDYGSLTPALPAGSVTGDALLLFASVRNTAAIVGTPAGWTPLLADGNVLLCGKYQAAGEVAPTVTFTGGALGDTVLAQVAAFRTTNLSINAGPTGVSNGSAQNIALPAALTPNRASSLMLVLGWKQDDWTTATALTDIGQPFSTAGNDAGEVWNYTIQTAAAASPTGFFTVTGGAAAISKSYVLFLNQQAAISTTLQAVYPPRVLVSVTNLVLGDAVAVYRSVAGTRTLVQGGSSTAVTDPSFLRVDGTLPFGVPVSYVAVVNGVEYTTAAVTYTLPGGKVVVSDAVSALAAEVVIWAWPEKQRERQASVFRPAGRNVAVLGKLSKPTADVELYTDAFSSVEQLARVIENATQGIVQIRQPGGYAGVDGFYAVLRLRERRWSQDGSDEKRITTLSLVEVSGWADAFTALGFTYANLATVYTGLTYANLSADYATYLLLSQANLS